MKFFPQITKLLFLMVGLISIVSCSDDDDNTMMIPEPTSNIVELAQSTNELSDLVRALVKFPDLVNLLSNDGNYTVFAPTNDAFDTLLAAIGQADIDDIPEAVLKNVLQYHVFTAAAVEASAVTTGSITMANGETTALVSDSNGVTAQGAQVIFADVRGTNGIVHVINNVMVPPSILPIVGTIVAPAYFNKEFTTLIAAVQAADPSILELLLSNGPNDSGLTLFAPTNDAFTAAGITDLSAVVDIVDTVLAYHVVDGTILSTELPATGISAAQIPTLLDGKKIYLTNKVDGTSVSINGKTQVVLEAANIMGSNGVVHVINRTLVPPTQTIADIVTSSSDFTLLTAALDRANLVGAFDEATDGPYTVFAPTDAAFIAAGFADVDAINAAPVDAVAGILTHHVVKPNAYVFSSDLSDGAVPMLNDQNVTISLGNLTVQDAAGSDLAAGLVTDSLNILTTNGVIHVIDKILLPSG